MNCQASYIDSDEALQDLGQAIEGADWLAFDTEFVRERTYYPRLCLVQLATPEVTACVDVLAVDASEFFTSILSQRSLVKVIHSARQDIEAMICTYGLLPAPVFDTQIAAALLGKHEQVSYAELVRQELDVQLDKDQTRTDWSRRPLSEKQLDYAAADVFYLAALYPQLKERLSSLGRLSWLEDECVALADRSLYVTEPEQAWRRLKGAGRLAANQHRVVRALAAWREAQAIDRDLPRGFIFKDKVLLEIATTLPQDKKALGDCGLSDGMLRRHGDALIGLIDKAACGSGDADLPRQTPDRLDAGQQKTLGRLQNCLKDCAGKLDINPTSIATRAQLEAMVRDPDADSHQMYQGWREELLGEAMRSILRVDAA